MSDKLTLVPISISDAKEYVARHHRHHKAPQGGLFAVACARKGEICGVAIIGRPVARNLQDGWTAEVTRLCTDGSKNACSMLYSAAWRAARALGYRRLGTYILENEPGTSLKAAGWKCIGKAGGGTWVRSSRPRIDKHPLQGKFRWEAVAIILAAIAVLAAPVMAADGQQPGHLPGHNSGHFQAPNMVTISNHAGLRLAINGTSSGTQNGLATHYGVGDGYGWRTTASGEVMNPWAMTAASWHYPLGTWLRVTNRANGASVVVKVNDRGGNELLDLSYGAFRRIARPESGVIEVKVEVIR